MIGGVRVEYKVDPEGTLFVTPGTAGAKHYSQLEDGIAEGISEDDYLGLFERLGGGPASPATPIRRSSRSRSPTTG